MRHGVWAGGWDALQTGLTEAMRSCEARLGQLQERGDGQSPEAIDLRQKLDRLREQIEHVTRTQNQLLF